MRRALLACSLLSAAFAAIQGHAHAQTAYTPVTRSDDLGAYLALNSLDLETGAELFERSAPLVIPMSTITNGTSTWLRTVFQTPVTTNTHAYFMGYERKPDGTKDHDALYKVDLSDLSYETIPFVREGNNFSLSSFVSQVNSGNSSTSVDLIPFHKRIDDNKLAIRKNKKAIDTNRTNINNLGDGIAASTALGAALSALPVTPDDAPFSCGVGSGAYSSRFAMGLGCVAKLNQRLSLNAGGSHVFGGSSNYGGGSLDSVAWRGGFVLKLGKLDSPAATNEQLQSQLNEVKQENASIKVKYEAMEQQNAAIKAKYSTIEEQNAVITQQNKALMARLERLEAIALGQQPATTTASLK